MPKGALPIIQAWRNRRNVNLFMLVLDGDNGCSYHTAEQLADDE